MNELANIEGSEIVVRVPISAIQDAAKVAFDEQFGFEQHNYVVTDPQKAAEALVRQLNKEDEEGSTPIHFLLDRALVAALDDGDEGFDDE